MAEPNEADQSTNRGAVWQSSALIVLMLVLWIAGFVPSFWVGVGVLAMIGVVFMIQQFPKYQTAAMWIFGAWLVMFIALPSVLNYFPGIRTEWGALRMISALKTAERMHPAMARAILVKKTQCQVIETRYTDAITTAYGALMKEYKPLIDEEIGAIAKLPQQDAIIIDQLKSGALIKDKHISVTAPPGAKLTKEGELARKLEAIRAKDHILAGKLLNAQKERQICRDWILAHAPSPDVKTPTDWSGWIAVLLPTYMFALAMAWSVKKPVISKVAEAIVISIVLILAIHWIATDGVDFLKALVMEDEGREFTKGRGLYWIFFAVLSGVTLLSGLWAQKLKAAVAGMILVFLLGLAGDWFFWQQGSLHQVEQQWDIWKNRPTPKQ